MRKLLSVAAAGFLIFTLFNMPATSASASTTFCDTTMDLVAGAYRNWVTVPAHGGLWECYLFEGDGPDSAVKALQTSINDCYIATGLITNKTLTVDGEFGANTKSALIAVQKWINLSYHLNIATDGGYGPQTYDNMSWQWHGKTTGDCFVIGAWYPW